MTKGLLSEPLTRSPYLTGPDDTELDDPESSSLACASAPTECDAVTMSYNKDPSLREIADDTRRTSCDCDSWLRRADLVLVKASV